ncbi:hypothetical protein [Mycobacterium sp. URHB0021]|jgi:hypothetical protein
MSLFPSGANDGIPARLNSIDLGRFLDELGHAPDVEGTAKNAAAARTALDDIVLDNYASPTRQGEFGSPTLPSTFLRVI